MGPKTNKLEDNYNYHETHSALMELENNILLKVRRLPRNAIAIEVLALCGIV